MKLSDFVAEWIANNTSGRVYSLCGAGAMHLNDSICHHKGISVLAMHHEQAATFAAEADYRVSGQVPVVSVTAGPGGTNTLTGVASAFVDSIPMIIIAGQAASNTLHARSQRQRGVNELDLAEIVKPIVKYSSLVTNAFAIKSILDTALLVATSGRPGPVWIDIPLDIQCADIEISTSRSSLAKAKPNIDKQVQWCSELLSEAKRPVLLIGNGVRISGAVEHAKQFADKFKLPVLSSWTASDIIPTDHPNYIGRPGLFGCRPSNFAIQNSDLVLAVGTRLSIPQTGHAINLFAPGAKKIVVDIDHNELSSKVFKVDLPIVSDAKFFFEKMLPHEPMEWPSWLHRCKEWKERYPVILTEHREQSVGVNSYAVIEELSKHLDDDAIIVTDVGAGFISAMQAMPLKKDQRLFHSCGVSAMGYGLPAAIGACIAGKGRQVVCLTGDGGLMLNLQELQTIAHHSLPIIVVVFANNGYMTMQITQNNHFKREAISSPKSGVSVPDFEEVAQSFGLPAWSLYDNKEMTDWMFHIVGRKHPMLCQLYMNPAQVLMPRVQSRVENGKFLPTPIEDLWPHLPRDEFAENMSH